MSQSARSNVFLQEMGIGVQWKMRQAADEGDAFVAAVQALADGLPEQDVPPVLTEAASQPAVARAPAGAAPRPVAVAPVEAVPRPSVVAAAEVAPPVPMAAAPQPPAPAPAPAAASGDESTAWFDDAPASPSAAMRPPAAVRPAAAPARQAQSAATQPPAQQPAAALDEESTAWFDDAPAPPPAATPARPTPPAAARQPTPPPSAMHDDESAAWFDDAPAQPPAAPAFAAPAGTAPVSDEAIAAMDWPSLQAAVSSCTRCTLCETRRNAVTGRGAENARWIAISGMPSRLDDEEAQAVTGEAGQLLHNMLKAIELQPDADVYITNVVKCRPDDRMPTADEVIACRPFLDRELALTGASMAMTFGQFAARGLMMGPAARGKVMHYGANQLPVVATYHPDDLLSKPEDKAKAWADLCLAKSSHA